MENERFQNLVLEHMARLTQDITEVKNQVSDLDAKVSNLGTRVDKIEIVIENDIALKFEAIFDGQKQMVEQLNRIEKKLDQHDEIIFKRIK